MARNPAPLTHAEQGDIAAHIVALITARRGGMNDRDFGELVSSIYIELIHPTDVMRTAMRHAYFVTQLATAAAFACDRWNQAAGDKPADRWLADVVSFSAVMRA